MPSLYQRHLARRVNGPLADRLQTRVRRRALAIATVASVAIAAWGIAVFDGRIWFLLLAALPLDVTAFLLIMSVRGVFELDDAQLDEYQIAERNRAYRTAYGTTLVFLVLVTLVAVTAQFDRSTTFAIAVFAFLVSALEPRLVLAWNMRDDIDEREFAGE